MDIINIPDSLGEGSRNLVKDFVKDSVPGRTVHMLTPHLMPDPTPVSKALSPLLTPLTDSINVIVYLSQGRDPYLYLYLSILACSQGGGLEGLLLLLK